MGLGINKDLEPLARAVRKAGGAVEVARSNHVRWTMPCGRVIWSGLTMSRATAEAKRREIEAALYDNGPGGDAYEVIKDARGHFRVVNRRTGEPLLNDNGFPRTFGSRERAVVVAREARNESGDLQTELVPELTGL